MLGTMGALLLRRYVNENRDRVTACVEKNSPATYIKMSAKWERERRVESAVE